MYDRVTLYIQSTSYDTTQRISSFLDGVEVTSDCSTGEESLKGKYGTMTVYMQSNGIVSINGSLAKFLNGDNVHTLNREDAEAAVMKLSDGFKVDPSDMRVTSIEFGSTFIMKKPPEAYFSKLGSMSRMVRNPIASSSLYYTTVGKQPSKVLCFYDKAAEIGRKHEKMPVEFQGRNLLRYEIRLRKRLPQMLKVKAVRAADLYDVGFYRGIAEMWRDMYFSISKKRVLEINADSRIKTVSDGFNAYVALMYRQGGEVPPEDFISNLRANGIMTDRQNGSRLRARINRAIYSASFTTSDDDIKELDNAVNEAVEDGGRGKAG